MLNRPFDNPDYYLVFFGGEDEGEIIEVLMGNGI